MSDEKIISPVEWSRAIDRVISTAGWSLQLHRRHNNELDQAELDSENPGYREAINLAWFCAQLADVLQKLLDLTFPVFLSIIAALHRES